MREMSILLGSGCVTSAKRSSGLSGGHRRFSDDVMGMRRIATYRILRPQVKLCGLLLAQCPL